MKYVCIENSQVISVLTYQPNVPGSVTVIEITDQQHDQIISRSHMFDTVSKTVVVNTGFSQTIQNQENQNAAEREFLRSTDWKIMRHIRQKVLGQTTSLSEQQYLELEQQRAAAAGRIV